MDKGKKKKEEKKELKSAAYCTMVGSLRDTDLYKLQIRAENSRRLTRYFKKKALKMDKEELIKLFMEKCYQPPKFTLWHRYFEDGKGVSLDNIFTERVRTNLFDLDSKYDVKITENERGYKIYGVNLDGLFNSIYVPGREVSKYDSNGYLIYRTNNELYSGDGMDYYCSSSFLQTKKVKILDYWLIPKKDYPAFKEFIDALREERWSLHQPKSLFETAARVSCGIIIPENTLPNSIKNYLKKLIMLGNYGYIN